MPRHCMTPSNLAPPDLVSIVIPVFNGARYLGEAIDSALAQSWPAIEVIVVDDGSDDGGATRRILDRYGNAIRVISKANGGVATALNAGIAAMRGSWFSWLSHDDVYDPLKIERYLAARREISGPAIAFGDVDLVNERGEPRERTELTRDFQGTDGRWAVIEGRVHGSAMLIPQVCLEACGEFDPNLPTTQDYAYWFLLARHFPFVAIRESLVKVREHADQGSHVPRHVEEASLLWASMLETMEADAAAAGPVERIGWLRRAERFLRARRYSGARAYVRARLDTLLGAVPLGALVATRDEADLDPAIAVLGAAGGRLAELTLIDRTEDARAALRLTLSPRLQKAVLVKPAKPGAIANPDDLLMAASRHDAAMTVFLDAAALPPPEALRQALLAVAAGEADGWLPGLAAPRAMLPTQLCGAVLSREALSKAAAGGPGSGLTGLARDWRLLGEIESRPERSAPRLAPDPPRPAMPGEMPAFGQPLLPGRPTLLMLVHHWGGGTIRYAATLGAAIATRVNVIYGWGVDQRRFHLSSLAPDRSEWEYDLEAGLDPLIAMLCRLGISRIDVVHSIGFDAFIEDFLDRLGLPFDVTLLDYHHVAQHPALMNESWAFLGDAALLRADHPIRRPGPPRLLLRAAARRIACSRDLAARIARFIPDLPVIAARLPEPGNPSGFAIHAPPLAAGETMRVLYLSRLAANKGVNLVGEVARLLAAETAAPRLYCLGSDDSIPPIGLQASGTIRLLGGYRQEDLNSLICGLRPHLAWLPFTAAETHSFALSDAMLQGLPILATGIGALPERLAGRPFTWLLPPEEATAANFAERLRQLQQDQLRTPPAWLPTGHLPPLTTGFYEKDYLRPLFQADH